MSTEYIRSVKVVNGAVIINSKSSNDGRPYHEWRSDSLTEIFQREGMLGLEREVLRMLYEYAAIHGSHPSMLCYRCLIRSKEAKAIRNEYLEKVNTEYLALSENDKQSLRAEVTPAAQKYIEFERGERDKMYQALAVLLQDQKAEPGKSKTNMAGRR